MSFKFERLDVWHKAIDFADEMYDLAEALPQKYQFSLGEQLRRAALSVPTNIAEGTGREKPKEAAYFYRVSKGSVYECVSLMVMILKRECINQDSYGRHNKNADEIAAMLSGLIRVQ